MNTGACQNLALGMQQCADTAADKVKQCIKLGAGDRAMLGGTLDLDDTTGAGLDDVAIEIGDAVLAVVEVEQRHAADIAGADRRDSLGERSFGQLTALDQAVQ